ncbi:MAG: transcription factor E [Promethearchaeota archaeon]
MSTASKTTKRLMSLQRSVLMEIGGKAAVTIAKKLLNLTKEVTDEELADLTKIKLNTVRKILYRLNENKLATFRRVRDKKSGWFLYYWRESLDHAKELVAEKQREVLQRLLMRLEFEKENQFFACENRNEECSDERYTFYEAMELEFRCPECDGRLEFVENADVIQFLEEKIDILKEELRKSG